MTAQGSADPAGDAPDQWRLAAVTCHTPDCGNAGHALVVYVADVPDPAVFCGPCGQPIADVVDDDQGEGSPPGGRP